MPGLEVLDYPSMTFAPQSSPQRADWLDVAAIGALTGVLVGGGRSLAGGTITVNAGTLTAAVTAGVGRYLGRKFAWSAGTATFGAASTSDRWDLVSVDITGTITVTAGTPASGGNDPIIPAKPANSIRLGRAYIAGTVPAPSTGPTTTAANFSTAGNITDARVYIDDPGMEVVEWYGAVGDGTTDDTAAWWSLVMQAPVSGTLTGPEFQARSSRYKINGYRMAAPTITSVVASAGGSLPATTTEFYRVVHFSAAGVTTGSTSVSGATTSANKTLTVTWTLGTDEAVTAGFPSTIIGSHIFRATTSGQELYVGTVMGSATTFVDTGAFAAGTGLLAAPTLSAPVVSTTGGLLPTTTTMRYSVAAMNGYGQTPPSAETAAAATTTATSSIALTCSTVTGAQFYVWYRRENTSQVGGIIGVTTTASFTDAGPAANSSGQPHPYGIAARQNCTGVVPTLNTSTVGVNFANRVCYVNGASARTGAGTIAGTTLFPGRADMTMLVSGLGTQVVQPGGAVSDIGISDSAFGVGGVTGSMVRSVNRMTFDRVFFHLLEAGAVHRNTGWNASTGVLQGWDNAWHTYLDATFYKCNWNEDCGDSLGYDHTGLCEYEIPDACVGISVMWPRGEPLCTVPSQATAGGNIKWQGSFLDGTSNRGNDTSGTSGFSGAGCRAWAGYSLEFDDVKMEAVCVGLELNGSGNFGSRGCKIQGGSWYGLTSGSNLGGYSVVLRPNVLGFMLSGTRFDNLYKDALYFCPVTEINWLAGAIGNMFGGSAFPTRNMLSDLSIAGGAKLTALLTGTATWNPGAVAVNTTSSVAVTVTGAVQTDTPHYAYTPALGAGASWQIDAKVTGANTVTVYFRNVSAASITPASTTVRASIFRIG